ncbi:MAG: hypothetical protein QXS42_01295 [Zestosphaera sp.]
MRLLSSRNAAHAEVQKILEGLTGKGIELESIEMRVLDYLRRFNKCRRGDELAEKLREMGLSEITAVIIANVVPKDSETLKILLNFEGRTLEAGFLEEVLNTVTTYCTE